MTLPGQVVEDGVGTSPARFPTDISTTFMVGETEKGPVGVPIYIRNRAAIEPAIGGQLAANPALWNALDLHFSLGGGPVYVSRLCGPSPVSATLDLSDSVPAATLRCTAATRVITEAGQEPVLLSSPGAWANALNVEVIAGGTSGTFILIVTHDTLGELERSPELADTAAAILWATNHADYLLLSELAGTGDPAVAGEAGLTSGTDDRSNIVTGSSTTAWSKLDTDLGYGQCEQPGATSEALHEVVTAHCAAMGRVPRLAGSNTASASTLVAQAAAVKGATGYKAATIEAPPYTIKPVAVGGTPRTVDAAVVACALESRNDQAGESPNQAAAGPFGIVQSDLVLGLAQAKWSDADRELLNDAGVTVHRVVGGQIRRYGLRTLANPDTETEDLQQPSHRLKMWLRAQLRPIGESFAPGRQINPGNLLDFAAQIEGQVKRLVDVPDPALASYVVVPGDLATCQAAKEFQAEIEYQRYPGAEKTRITISQAVTA